MKIKIDENWLKDLVKAELTLRVLKRVYSNDEMFKAVLVLDDIEGSANSVVNILKRDQQSKK